MKILVRQNQTWATPIFILPHSKGLSRRMYNSDRVRDTGSAVGTLSRNTDDLDAFVTSIDGSDMDHWRTDRDHIICIKTDSELKPTDTVPILQEFGGVSILIQWIL